MLPKINPTETQAWKQLTDHRRNMGDTHLRELFLNDPMRFREFSITTENILFDFSKNLISAETLNLFKKLFEECKLKNAVESFFNGAKINETENRAVLHTALRNFSGKPIFVEGQDVMPLVRSVLAQMKEFSENLISGNWKGYTGHAITDVVNIGIGGSDLGPAMVYEALKPYRRENIKCHFVSNIDGAHIAETLKHLNPDTTLFIIASKTFSTQETMTNAHSARDWFLNSGATKKDIEKHFVAVSTNIEAATDFGINQHQMFEFWDWVGGRYSVWSSIGLSLCCGLGFDNFEKLLKGAHSIDEHFRTEPFHQNVPMLMAAIGIWYVNFFGTETEAIIPYDQNMHRFASYFQQGNMESNGKTMDRNGKAIAYSTGPIVWGAPGTNGQHAFFQLIHQGTHVIPCDFIGFANSHYKMGDHHQKLMANFFAQTEALMKGQSREEISQLEDDERKISYKIFAGNKPTTSILADKCDPRTLGKLMACYEHKIFVQGIIWNIYSFDQWGVELGKKLAKTLLPKLGHDYDKLFDHDSSTAGLIKTYKLLRKKH